MREYQRDSSVSRDDADVVPHNRSCFRALFPKKPSTSSSSSFVSRRNIRADGKDDKSLHSNLSLHRSVNDDDRNADALRRVLDNSFESSHIEIIDNNKKKSRTRILCRSNRMRPSTDGPKGDESNTSTCSFKSDDRLLVSATQGYSGQNILEDVKEPNNFWSDAAGVFNSQDMLEKKTAKTCTTASVGSSNGDQTNTLRRSRKVSENGAFPSPVDDSFDSGPIVDVQKRKNLSKSFRGCVKLKKKQWEADYNDEEEKGVVEPLSEYPIMHQAAAFNTSIVEDSEFPQIIFANESPKKKKQPENEAETSIQTDEGKVTGYFRVGNNDDNDMYSPSLINEKKFGEVIRSRSPSPARVRQNASPPSKSNSRSRSRGRSSSRSRTSMDMDELQEEEIYLDSLAKSFSETNYYSGLKNEIAAITGKTAEERMSVQNAEIPKAIEFDESDSVSEVDMDGVSVGKDTSTDSEDVDENTPDYHDSVLRTKVNLKDERSSSWRMRDDYKQTDETNEYVPAKSLLDVDTSESYSADENDKKNEEDPFSETTNPRRVTELPNVVTADDYTLSSNDRNSEPHDLFKVQNSSLEFDTKLPPVEESPELEEEVYDKENDNRPAAKPITSIGLNDSLTINKIRPPNVAISSPLSMKYTKKVSENKTSPIKSYLAQKKMDSNDEDHNISSRSLMTGIMKTRITSDSSQRSFNSSFRSSKYREVPGGPCKIDRQNSILSLSSTTSSTKSHRDSDYSRPQVSRDGLDIIIPSEADSSQSEGINMKQGDLLKISPDSVSKFDDGW